ncbi:MAG: hypothetical protein CME62_15790 [Halobacteriovoraceae bacterium]|nr:hypothetical protein [Halobacteriovoraceae bacterium]|tara:strand:+ start:203 stop:493 length:291 start_codon:yes stop_codon:yes gene_type:complete
MKLIALFIFLNASLYAVEMTYCGQSAASVSGESDIHLRVHNKKNNPPEIVIEDMTQAKVIWDKQNEYDSDYICLKGILKKEDSVYFLSKLSTIDFY